MMQIEEELLLPPDQNEGQTIQEEPKVLEEIIVEELSIDGICGVY